MAGAALRAVLCPAGKTRLWPWLLAAGAGLACACLDREDAGLFLLPFGAAATLILLVVLARARRWRACAAQLIPYGVLAAAVLAFCGMNQSRYGVFALSDFSEGPFAAAMGAMMRVDTGNDDPLLSVPADARQKLYAAVPELEPLAYWLEEDPQMRNDFQDPERQDYRAGSFYWAIRRAAQYEGVYDSARTAADYWQGVADAVNAACDDGTLPSRTGKRAATSQPVKLSYVAPTLAETARSVVHVLAFADCAPYETARSIGTGEDIAQWSAYLHCGFNSAAEAGKDTPYYSPYQKLVFGLMEAVAWVYRALLWLGLLAGLACHFAALPAVLRRRTAGAVVPWLLLLGLLGMALLRCAMIAFVEVSSFGIGTSTMYLATVHPLFLLYAFLSLAAYGRSIRRKESGQ